ncbi:hypothetical protein [Paenibacillus pectinilyticus]
MRRMHEEGHLIGIHNWRLAERS